MVVAVGFEEERKRNRRVMRVRSALCLMFGRLRGRIEG